MSRYYVVTFRNPKTRDEKRYVGQGNVRKTARDRARWSMRDDLGHAYNDYLYVSMRPATSDERSKAVQP